MVVRQDVAVYINDDPTGKGNSGLVIKVKKPEAPKASEIPGATNTNTVSVETSFDSFVLFNSGWVLPDSQKRRKPKAPVHQDKSTTGSSTVKPRGARAARRSSKASDPIVEEEKGRELAETDETDWSKMEEGTLVWAKMGTQFT